MTRVPQRFVGLHAHDGFSVNDGLGYPQEHLDFVVENGMDAWCLTNHGHMNSFCHAYFHAEKLIKAGKLKKFVCGVEAYLHPSLDDWKHEYELRQSEKGDAKKQQHRKKRLEEGIQTIITPETDPDGETVGIETRGSLTLENEDDSKTMKVRDPLKRRHHLVILPRTSIGLERVFHLVSRGYTEGFYQFPRIDYRMLKEASSGGHLMVSSACIAGIYGSHVFNTLQSVKFNDLNTALLDNPSVMDEVVRLIAEDHGRMMECVGRDAAFLELQFNKLPAQNVVNRAIIEYARRTNNTDKLVVTADSHYSRPELWRDREIYKKLGWLNYTEMNPESIPNDISELKCELYPKNASQVWDSYLTSREGESFYDDEEVCAAIERTHDIMHEFIGDVVPDTSVKLPTYVIPKGKSAFETLVDECKVGLRRRGLADKPEYITRLRDELSVIKNKGFALYFLTLKRCIEIARGEMLVGPGRGSGGGSLVNYVLWITDIDPVQWNMLFERFMSVHRCLIPGTNVVMFDGTTKKIEDVVIGDLVKTRSGSVAVCDTSTSAHNEVYDVTVGGKVVTCSADHQWPIKRNGVEILVRTVDLQVDDMMLMQDDSTI